MIFCQLNVFEHEYGRNMMLDSDINGELYKCGSYCFEYLICGGNCY